METSKARVCVRIRPLSELEECSTNCLDCLSDTKVACSTGEECNVFTFDRVLRSEALQQDIYHEVKSIVDSVLNGNNGAILTYGQTGSGKTHTLIGNVEDEEKRGVAPRAISELVGAVAKDEYSSELSITVSSAEIYCERIFDLLEPCNIDLQIKQDAVKGVYVSGLVELTVANEAELNLTMQRAINNRTVSSTAMNDFSSRSHCLFYVNITHIKQQKRYGTLCMVDLAGSERQTKTGTTGLQFDEGILINKSLSALANVICALTDGRSKHVPYRDSKLTRVLQNCIGGNSQTTLIICCSPAKSNLHETLSSLRFGSRARGVTNTIQVLYYLSCSYLSFIYQSSVQSLSNAVERQLIESREEMNLLKDELDRIRIERDLKNQGITRFKRILRKKCIVFCLHFLSFMLCFILEDYFRNL
eukprot:g4587.t1